MDRRRAEGYARYGVAYPAATLLGVAALGHLTVGTGLAVLGASMVAAAVLTGVYATGTRAQGGGDDRRRTAVGLRAEVIGPVPDPGAGRRARFAVFAGGLFAQSALSVLWLGGLF